jgi:hypothetical protein
MDRNRQLQQVALGRIFRLLSRPFQEGDVEAYEAARRTLLDTADTPAVAGYVPNYARDRWLGAAGDVA